VAGGRGVDLGGGGGGGKDHKFLPLFWKGSLDLTCQGREREWFSFRIRKGLCS